MITHEVQGRQYTGTRKHFERCATKNERIPRRAGDGVMAYRDHHAMARCDCPPPRRFI